MPNAYTTTPPSEAGWYRWKSDETAPMQCVEVLAGVHLWAVSAYRSICSLEDFGGLWHSDRIQEPMEGE